MTDHDQRKLTFERCQALLTRFLTLFEEETGGALLGIALFGSVARGKGGRTSDLDLLILHQGHPEVMLHRFVHVLYKLRRSYEYQELQTQGFLPDPSPVFFTKEELSGHPWLLLDILDHGIILLDRENLLQRELDRLKERLRALGARKIVLPDGTWYWDLKPDWKPGEIIEL